jgi:hypothetical protein
MPSDRMAVPRSASEVPAVAAGGAGGGSDVGGGIPARGAGGGPARGAAA